VEATNDETVRVVPVERGPARSADIATELRSGDTTRDFLDYFGLVDQPFGVTPDPRFLFLGSKHRQALAALEYGTASNRGFLALIAKPGMGKTSLLFQYLESQRNTARTAFVFQTDGDSTDFMRYLLTDLNLNAAGKDLAEMRSMLNDVLIQEMNAGRRFILVIDEAQNFDEKVLESIRLLSNFETPWAKLMQIVMAGQPQLAECLGRTSMTQLRQRISFFVKLEPFTAEETGAYIDHRLRIAGHREPQLFTVGAFRKIAESSQGIPRTINNICFAAMSLAWMLKRTAIDRDIVSEVLEDLSPEPIDVCARSPLPPAESAIAAAKDEPISAVNDPSISSPTIREIKSQGTKSAHEFISQRNSPSLAVESSVSGIRSWPLTIATIALVLLALSWSYIYITSWKPRVALPKAPLPVSTASGAKWKAPLPEGPALSHSSESPAAQ
jgi:type II secretory pathway predicted ATPase ExeA